MFMSRLFKVGRIQMYLWGIASLTCMQNVGAWGMVGELFKKMPSQNVVSWTAILGGCAMHGHGKDVLNECVKKVYSQMKSFLFVFCQLVAMQVRWMKACTVMLP